MDKDRIARRTLEGELRRRRRELLTEADLIEAIREDEATTGRIMLPSEREAFTRAFFADEYAQDIELTLWMNILAREADEDGEE